MLWRGSACRRPPPAKTNTKPDDPAYNNRILDLDIYRSVPIVHTSNNKCSSGEEKGDLETKRLILPSTTSRQQL